MNMYDVNSIILPRNLWMDVSSCVDSCKGFVALKKHGRPRNTNITRQLCDGYGGKNVTLIDKSNALSSNTCVLCITINLVENFWLYFEIV